MNANLANAAAFLLLVLNASALEGRIHASLRQGQDHAELLYTISGNRLRIERMETNGAHTVDLILLDSDRVTLVYPQNHGFVQLAGAADNPSDSTPPGLAPPPEGIAGGIGPAPPPGATAFANMAARPGFGTANSPGLPAPPTAMEKIQFQETGEKTNLLGFVCKRYDLKQRGETMEIWATDQLFPFQAYLENQPGHIKSHFIESRWPELVRARKLFPLLATMKFGEGTDRFRFEVQSISTERLTEEDMKLFEPPAGYAPLKPLPF